MKVLYIIHALPIGGAETIVVSYLTYLKKRGVDVSLIEFFHEDSFLTDKIKSEGINYYTLIGKSKIDLITNKLFPKLYVRKLNRIIKLLGPDVIHFHTTYKYMNSIDFPLNKCVFTFHATVSRTITGVNYAGNVIGEACTKGLNLIALTDEINQEIHNFFPNAKSHVIPNGVELNVIRLRRGDRKALLHEMSIPEDSFIIGQVGRFNEVKNHIFTLSLMPLILSKHPNTYLLLVGTGSSSEIHRLENLIEEYGIDNHVRFLGLRNDATSLMTCFDALVLPSLSESFSLVLIEAQANNVRCVASDRVPDSVICNNNCVSLSLNEDKNVWINAIFGKLNNNNIKDINNFDINNVIDEHITLYRSLS